MITPDPSAAARLIAVDWGSTNFRASLLIGGRLADRVESADGIRNRDGRDYDDLLTSLVGHWRPARVVMSGMIGSREGWREIPYVTAPAGITELRRGIQAVESRHFPEIALVPGLRWDDPVSGATDVMRGEETQIAGLLPTLPADTPTTLCLPGTHSKWVVCHEGKIARFRTFLTGEAYERLTRDSLIAGTRDTAADPDSPAFARGVALSASASGGLLHHLFLGRTEMLTGRVSPEDLRSFISGILIGHELRDARAFAEGPVTVIGDSPAARATLAAARFQGIPSSQNVSDVHLAGLLGLA